MSIGGVTNWIGLWGLCVHCREQVGNWRYLGSSPSQKKVGEWQIRGGGCGRKKRGYFGVLSGNDFGAYRFIKWGRKRKQTVYITIIGGEYPAAPRHPPLGAGTGGPADGGWTPSCPPHPGAWRSEPPVGGRGSDCTIMSGGWKEKDWNKRVVHWGNFCGVCWVTWKKLECFFVL